MFERGKASQTPNDCLVVWCGFTDSPRVVTGSLPSISMADFSCFEVKVLSLDQWREVHYLFIHSLKFPVIG